MDRLSMPIEIADQHYVVLPAAAYALTVDLATTRSPYFVQNREITVKEARVIARTKPTTSAQVAIAPGVATPDLAQNPWTGQGTPGPWTLGTDSDPMLVEDVFVILSYSAS